MDNIVVKKKWEDSYGVELSFCFITSYVTINTVINVTRDSILNNNDIFQNRLANDKTAVTLLFGHLGEDYAPGIELKVTINRNGHVEIEASVELADDMFPKHKCSFSLSTEIGIFANFMKDLCSLTNASIETEYSLISLD